MVEPSSMPSSLPSNQPSSGRFSNSSINSMLPSIFFEEHVLSPSSTPSISSCYTTESSIDIISSVSSSSSQEYLFTLSELEIPLFPTKVSSYLIQTSGATCILLLNNLAYAFNEDQNVYYLIQFDFVISPSDLCPIYEVAVFFGENNLYRYGDVDSFGSATGIQSGGCEGITSISFSLIPVQNSKFFISFHFKYFYS